MSYLIGAEDINVPILIILLFSWNPEPSIRRTAIVGTAVLDGARRTAHFLLPFLGDGGTDFGALSRVPVRESDASSAFLSVLLPAAVARSTKNTLP